MCSIISDVHETIILQKLLFLVEQVSCFNCKWPSHLIQHFLLMPVIPLILYWRVYMVTRPSQATQLPDDECLLKVSDQLGWCFILAFSPYKLLLLIFFCFDKQSHAHRIRRMGVILAAILLWLIDSNEAYTIVVMHASQRPHVRNV